MIQEIKSRINCVEYAQKIGLSIRKSGDRCISPLRSIADNKTAFVVYNDFWYDFVSQIGGDIIDLCANVNYNGDRRQAIQELSKLTGASSENYGDWKKYTQNLCNQIQLWHESLSAEHTNYLHNRKITDETIKRLKIGAMPNKRLVIPYWKNNYVCYYISRAFLPEQEPKYKKALIDELNENAPWGMHTLNRGKDILVIVEGAFDALSFEQEGYSVLATMGGHFSHNQLLTVKDICKQYKQVFICFDNDNAGENFTLKLSKFLFKNKINFLTGQIPAKYKDVSDYYTDGNNLADLITDAKDGLLGLCEKISDKEEFKNFAYQASRFICKPELAELFKIAQQANNYPQDWFAELKKSCFSPPSEDMIAKQINAKYKLKYIDELGFYEYQRGYWAKRTDTEIQSYISDELGYYRTGSRISSIIKLIKSDVVTTELFNKKPLFNFINGTLNLNDYSFNPHNESDLCSMQVDYPYDFQAHSQLWEDFICDIADGDPKRMALLQEIAGYILFPDCSLQKCFFLLGEGANGKSVFLDIITNVFGEKSTSNVELPDLVEPFQRIQLLHSIVNISGETKTDVKGAEAIFKQIVAGGRILACHKNKDFINFRSRSKLIFACNEIISAKDLTYGLERRMCFVKFINKFVDYPTLPHEYKKDIDITEKLLKDLPAIFNWALEGYKTLKVCKEFTQTDDADELLQNFRETINPIVVFIGENPIEERITNEELYNLYRQWCSESGHMPKSRTAFIRAFKQSMPKGYQEYKTVNTRGIEVKSKVKNNVELL